MALFSMVLDPVDYMQTLQALVSGVCSYLDGTAKPDDAEFVKKNLDLIDRELSTGHGLLKDTEVHSCEDDLVVVYYQLGAVVRASQGHTKRETEVFLKYVEDYRLERQLTAMYSRLMGVSLLTNQPTLLDEIVRDYKPKRWELREFCEKVNFVLGTGLLCLFTQASLTGRDQALLMKTWSEKMAALSKKMKMAGCQCSDYFREQAKEDVKRLMEEGKKTEARWEEQATAILRTLEKNYDWLRWAVMVTQERRRSGEVVEEGQTEGGCCNEGGVEKAKCGNLISVSDPSGLQVVACYSGAPSSLDKGRIHQLIVDLEWKIPNPPPEVYATIEAEPHYARTYLASRMLNKLEEGLDNGVSVHVVPGKMEMKCNFPQASFFLYEYKHRLASGTVCIFG
ncbi:hypothetical protein AOXY_G8468 [Acipenser oxyrinchus oxyrinchus]|uniref:Uncharacterized protein n=1 Tax=Acipenser oxyrinchus oxyrinchus TaxID=40147 RepID=A0AAD8DJ77_ACIOX|nr:hypothetical protein AOXY_G8468 [Acipenser oxyrinchus oxyrinchus]